MPTRIDLNIAGYTLSVMSDRSPEHLQQLGSMVNERVREIQKGGSTTNYLNVILLSAITLADEVLDLKEKLESQNGKNEEAEKSLLAALELALDQ